RGFELDLPQDRRNQQLGPTRSVRAARSSGPFQGRPVCSGKGGGRESALLSRPQTPGSGMARPTVVVDGSIWKVYPTGRVTVYGKDEFGLLFELGTGPERKRRFTRYSPLGSKSSDASLAELTERQLLDLFHQSQP